MPQFSKQLLRLDSTLEELILYQAEIDCETLGIEVLKLFERTPLLPGVTLIRQKQLVGMISRRHFFEQMSRPYSLELFSNRPIYLLYELIQTEPLVFPLSTSIVAVARRCLQRSRELLYEPVVVQDSQDIYQLLDMHQVLLAQSKIHELAMEALKKSQAALFQEKEMAQITLQSIGDAVITTNALGYVESLNPVAEKLTGWTFQEARGLPLSNVFTIIHKITREPAKSPVEIVLREGRSAHLAPHTLLISQDGSEFAIDDSAAPIYGKDGQLLGAVLVFRDVTQERQMADQLSWQANHDALTGLFNRRAFERLLEKLLALDADHRQPHVLCYIDLDRFKVINDSCGHRAGDELLCQISSLFQGEIRKTDILARLGGDEFGLLLYQCPLEKAYEIATTIRDKVQAFRFVWQENTFTLGASIGLAAIKSKHQKLSSILSAADAACYEAKNKGRNRVCIYQVSSNALTEQPGEGRWVTRITRALKDNNFRLYYQPITSIQFEKATFKHYEILLRMIDQQGQVISPADFIPVAERYSLMPAIDRWVIHTLFASYKEAFQQLGNHGVAPDHACGCIYAVNLSGASLNDDQFTDFLKEQFACWQVPPQTICFEITETIAIVNLSKASQFIGDLKRLGCRFALDDFGRGMSSFAYLKNLPVDYIKIDGGFVKDIDHDLVAQTIVEGISRIAQVMGMQTIAEFVENDTILARVKDLGINYAQGYAIAKPTPLPVDLACQISSNSC
ncbi:MAG: EAL domain-containing protein [Leptolyngbyaceae bacterium]|nr:EAL domain-containing protein [Leptolyngbyaceae bacterium]